jgi:hypothetical protein
MNSDDRANNEQTRKAQVAEFEASGMTVKAWCAQSGMCAATLRYWRRKLAGTADSAKWVDIADAAANGSACTAIVPAGGCAAVIHIGKASIEVFRHTDAEAINKACAAALALC